MAVFTAGAAGGLRARVAVDVVLPAGVEAAGAVTVVLPAGAETGAVCAGAGRNPARSRMPQSVRTIERGNDEDWAGWGVFIGDCGDK